MQVKLIISGVNFKVIQFSLLATLVLYLFQKFIPMFVDFSEF